MRKSLIRVFIVCLLTGCITQKLMGQESVSYVVPDITPTTPQTWNFITYGGKPFDLHTGTIGVTIPIYTYEDRDFTLPISLSYASNGFRPNAQADIVGYDWHLNVGGIITREKRGLPDEYKLGTDNSNYRYGYYEYHRLENELTTFDTSKRTFNESQISLWKTDNTDKYEIAPDVFRFNFMDYRGAFQMGEKQKVYVYDTNFPSGELNVEIKVKTAQNNNRYLSFIFTTGDGMKYYFGQNKYSIDCVKSFNPGTDMGIFDEDDHVNLNNNTVDDSNAEAIAWHLDTIVAPNGRKIIFNYDESDRNVITHYSEPFCMAYSKDGVPSPYNNHSIGYNYTSSAILESIVIGGWKVDFEYVKRSGKYKNEKSRNNGDFIVSSDVLKNITVASGRNTLKRCTLNYCGGQKMLLQNVDISGEGSYTMNYYNEDKINNIPAVNTLEIDHWGYWNNNSSINVRNFLPHINTQLSDNISPFESNPDVELPNERNSNFQATMWGMLTDIKYPTGGSSHFEYESHEYGKAVKHCPTLNTSLDDYAPTLVEESGIAGGVRIKSIEDFDEHSQSVSKRSYVYKYPESYDYTYSSGILLKYPRYRIIIQAVNRNNINDVFSNAYVIRDDFCVYKYEKSNVEYRCVLEKYDDGSYTEYMFNCYEDIPDQIEYEKYIEFQPPLDTYKGQMSPNHVNGAHNLLKTPTSFRSERGKLSSKIHYDSKLKSLSGVRYVYSYQSRFVESPMYIPYISCYKRKDKIDNFTLDSVVYYKNNMIFKKVGYRYNDAKQLSRQIEYNSNGSRITTFYDYVKDKQDYNTAEEKMIERNIIKYPLREYKILRFDNIPDNYVVDYNRVKYSVVNNLVLPRQVDKAYLDELESKDVEQLSTYNDQTFSAYDMYGNVTEVKDKLNRYTCYIWSSNGLYLLAKIANASLSAVNTLLASAPESQDTVKLSSDKETTLRNNLPNAMITTYEYKPYVGITSITDPNGCKITYEYNSTGKLCAEYDHEGNIIRKYDYSTDK